MVGSIFAALCAVPIGIGLYIVDFRLAKSFSMAFFGQDTGPDIQFTFLILTVLLLLTPLFQEECSPEMRAFSIVSVATLLAIVVGRASGTISLDPNVPYFEIAQRAVTRLLHHH